jgi:hypothetical protein
VIENATKKEYEHASPQRELWMKIEYLSEDKNELLLGQNDR